MTDSTALAPNPGSPAAGSGDVVVQVRNLHTHFKTAAGVARAVDGISFDINRGETFALVGESGCGKSVTALSIMQLVPKPAGFHPDGQILLDGQDILSISERDKRRKRVAPRADAGKTKPVRRPTRDVLDQDHHPNAPTVRATRAAAPRGGAPPARTMSSRAPIINQNQTSIPWLAGRACSRPRPRVGGRERIRK